MVILGYKGNKHVNMNRRYSIVSIHPVGLTHKSGGWGREVRKIHRHCSCTEMILYPPNLVKVMTLLLLIQCPCEVICIYVLINNYATLGNNQIKNTSYPHSHQPCDVKLPSSDLWCIFKDYKGLNKKTCSAWKVPYTGCQMDVNKQKSSSRTVEITTPLSIDLF